MARHRAARPRASGRPGERGAGTPGPRDGVWWTPAPSPGKWSARHRQWTCRTPNPETVAEASDLRSAWGTSHGRCLHEGWPAPAPGPACLIGGHRGAPAKDRDEATDRRLATTAPSRQPNRSPCRKQERPGDPGPFGPGCRSKRGAAEGRSWDLRPRGTVGPGLSQRRPSGVAACSAPDPVEPISVNSVATWMTHEQRPYTLCQARPCAPVATRVREPVKSKLVRGSAIAAQVAELNCDRLGKRSMASRWQPAPELRVGSPRVICRPRVAKRGRPGSGRGAAGVVLDAPATKGH